MLQHKSVEPSRTKASLTVVFSLILPLLLGLPSPAASTAQTSALGCLGRQSYLPLIVKSSSLPPGPPVPSPPLPVPTMTVRMTDTIAFIADEYPAYPSLWIANVDGSGEKKILDGVSERLHWPDEWKNHVAWSPDGQWLAVNRCGGLWILSPDGDGLREVVPVDWNQGGDIVNFAWSPDGARIAFLQMAESSTVRLGIVEPATGQIRYLIEDPGYEHRVVWSPDSQWLAFADFDENLSVINVATAAISSLGYACQAALIEAVSWSPQSDRLAVMDESNGRYSHDEACIITLAGQKIDLDVGGASGKPFWSSDGEQLIVSAVNFDPDDPDLEEDPRLLLFDKAGQLIKRLNVTTEIGELVEMSPDRQQFLSWIADDPDWFRGYVQIAGIGAQPFSHRARVPDRIGRLVHDGGDLNSLYLWTADSRHGVFLALTELGDSYDLNYGSLYAFDGQMSSLRRITNDHRIKYAAASPVLE